MNTNLEELDFIKTEEVYKKVIIFLKEKLGIIKNFNKEDLFCFTSKLSTLSAGPSTHIRVVLPGTRITSKDPLI